MSKITIDKAIEILKLDLTYTYPARFDDLQDAIKVAIDGLTFLQECHTDGVLFKKFTPKGEDPQ